MKYKKKHFQKGFTIIETVIVVGLLMIVVALLFNGFREYTAYQQYNQALQSVKVLIQETQTDARLSIGGGAHGIKIEANRITQFNGSSFDISNPSNKSSNFNTIVLIPNLSGGVDEIVFNNLSGHPRATGTIEILGVSYNSSDEISISAGGVVE